MADEITQHERRPRPRPPRRATCAWARRRRAATRSPSAPARPASSPAAWPSTTRSSRSWPTAGLGDKVESSIIGCHGLCSISPVVVLSRRHSLRATSGPRTWPSRRGSTSRAASPSRAPSTRTPRPANASATGTMIGFYSSRRASLLRDVGVIDPETSTTTSRAAATRPRRTVAERADAPSGVIARRRTDSGLRGRGGAGFPTGIKWASAGQSKSAGEVHHLQRRRGRPGRVHGPRAPGGRPARVIEGMIIGSFAIGAHEGYVYVRAEYPLAVERLDKAMAGAEARASSATTSSAPASSSTSTSSRAPAPSSAARRPR